MDRETKRFLSPTTGALCALAAALALAPAPARAWERPGQPVAREHRQQARIAGGVASGALTPGETRSLERQEARIEAMRRSAWADGSLSTADRRRLTLAQDRASDHIYDLKHNARRD